jgi:glycosyltransferase involved in cell wall biosynthesis
MSRNDIAIYLPSTAGFYDRARGRSAGAERQMVLLAHTLSERGYRVAQIVWPIADRLPLPNARLTLVARSPRLTAGGKLAALREAVEVWRALAVADAKVVIVRKRQGALPVVALFCLLRRRRLIFSSANNGEFNPGSPYDGRPSPRVYRLCLRLAAAVVVQSEDQLALARRNFPSLRRVVRIPSFAESATRGSTAGRDPKAFVWIGRIVDWKQPVRFVELARALPEARFVMVAAPDISEPDSPLIPMVKEAPRDTPNLEVLDPLPHAQVTELVASAAAVVNTSRGLEGMPNTFLEGWAAGVPALTLEFDPDGVISTHRLGVSAGNSWERFVAGAWELWESRGHREEVAERTRAYVRDVHSLESVAEQWSRLVHEVARLPEPPPAREEARSAAPDTAESTVGEESAVS